MRIDNALTWAAEQLEGGESPSIDAKVMLANILGEVTNLSIHMA